MKESASESGPNNRSAGWPKASHRKDFPRLTASARGGFTLIELLVVVGIIGILSALLLSALGRAKGVAYSGKCRSNLHQMGLAFRLYLDDNNVYPSGFVSFPDGQRLDWIDLVAPYLDFRAPQQDRNGVFNCPAFRSQRPPRGFAGEVEVTTDNVEYGYNYEGFAGFGLGPAVYVGRPGNAFVKEQDVARPTEMIAAGDAFKRIGRYILDGSPVLARAVKNIGPAVASVQQDGPALHRRAQKRHNGQVNLLFADDHVSSVPLQKAFLEDTDDQLKRWNRDHEPHRDEWKRILQPQAVP
jgi:prepilin-type N-terminal cleavage/methylation domain-containing protein/prepilin-type processing-associated H-X9-DG protein